jgi:UrcA family protein
MRALTYFSPLRNLIATAAFSALASGFSAVAAAADSPHTPTAIVKYGDLNVSTAEGATELYGRIRSAATHVCSSFDRPLDRNSQALRADCIGQAIANGVAALNEPALFMVYKANGGTPLPRTLVSQRR